MASETSPWRTASRRRYLKTVAGIGGASSLAGCAGLLDGGSSTQNGEGTDGDLPSEEITIGFVGTESLMYHPYRGPATFKRIVETGSDGNITVQIQTGLGSLSEQIEQVANGTIEMVSGPTAGQLGAFDPDVKSWTIPFLFENLDIASHVLDHSFGRNLRSSFREKTGMRMLSWYDNGPFRVFGFDREVQDVSDFEGLQVRVQGGGSMEVFLQQVGAEPVAIDPVELYESLDQGIVNGMDISLILIPSLNLHEVVSHVFVTNHVYSQSHMLCNEGWFQDLHPEYQNLVLEAGYQATIDNRRINALVLERTRNSLASNEGTTVIEPDDTTLSELEQATQSAAEDRVRSQVDDERWVDRIHEAVDTATQELNYE